MANGEETPKTKQAEAHGATIETPERASVSKYLEKFEKASNVALMPDVSLASTKSTSTSPDHHQQQRKSPPNKQKQQEPSTPKTPTTTPKTATSPTSASTNNVRKEPDAGSLEHAGSLKLDSPPSSPELHPHKKQQSSAGKDNKRGIDSNDSKLLTNSLVKTSTFAQECAAQPLRICCYGSSSSQTPDAYLRPAAEVGYLLAVRGHTCVNGAGSFGCMAAMNEGAAAGNGHIVGVIHKMWLVDGDDDTAEQEWEVKDLRDGGAHPVFDTTTKSSKQKQGNDGPIREMLVAGGKDLQERKRLLVEGANALIVLPGGPGTWDELWEMACARNLGLSKLPIVCVNVDGYYEPFRQMLQRAWDDQLCKLEPDKVVHFADTAEEAVRWVEDVQGRDAPAMILKKRKEALRSQSVLGTPVTERRFSVLDSLSSLVGDAWTAMGNEDDSNHDRTATSSIEQWSKVTMALGVGLMVGFLLSEARHNNSFERGTGAFRFNFLKL